MKPNPNDIARFFGEYPAAVGDLAQRLRSLVRAAMPNAREELDRPARVIGYSFAPGYSGLLCTIIISKEGVKLGIVRGAALPDPRRLLEGSGKQHRHVAFSKPADLERPGLTELLHDAVESWHRRSNKNA